MTRAGTTMRAVRVDAFGGPEVLQLVQLPIPAPGPGEVRIRVGSAAVNFSDVMRRRASPYPFPTPLPYFPGSEVAGTIDAIGQGVARLEPGMPVLAVVGRGGEAGYAQYAIASAPQVIPIPGALDMDVAAGLLVAGATAVLVLRDTARVAAGERVYVQAAAGGVGSLAVQIAKQLGATVIAGASSEAKRRFARELGADAAIDSSHREWSALAREAAGGGLDVVLDMQGGESLEQSLACLAPFGRVVVYGAASGAPRTLGRAALDRWLSDPALGQQIHAFNVGLFFGARPAAAAAAIESLIGWVLSGQVRPHVGHVLPLSQVADAHRLLEERRSVGKIVLRPWD